MAPPNADWREMEIQVTQEQVDAIIEREVTKALDNLTFYRHCWDDDFEYVGLDRYVKEAVEDKIEKYLSEKFDALVDEELSHVVSHEVMTEFLSKPVKITDGYRETEYDSYANYLLKVIHNRTFENWKIRDMIQSEVKRRVDELWKQCEADARESAIESFSAKIRTV